MLNKVLPIGLLAVLSFVAVNQLIGPGDGTRTEVFPSSTAPVASSTIPGTSVVDLPDVTLVDFNARATVRPAVTTEAESTSTESSATSASSSSSSSGSTTGSTSSSTSTSTTLPTIPRPTVTISLPTTEITLDTTTRPTSTETTERPSTSRVTSTSISPPPTDGGGEGDDN